MGGSAKKGLVPTSDLSKPHVDGGMACYVSLTRRILTVNLGCNHSARLLGTSLFGL